MNIGRQPGEVTFSGRTKERRRRWILGMEKVSEWRQHCDASVASTYQGGNIKCVERIWSVGDG